MHSRRRRAACRCTLVAIPLQTLAPPSAIAARLPPLALRPASHASLLPPGYGVNVEALVNLYITDTHAELCKLDLGRYGSILLVPGCRNLHDVLKGFNCRNKLDERAEYVLRAAGVK